MAILGLGQVVLAHPELRATYAPVMERAADRLVARQTLRFGQRAYGRHPLDSLASAEGHAYLGYVALALGMLRAVNPQTPHARLHDRLVASLARRLDRAPRGVIETYPGATFPPDVASVAGAIGLHQRTACADHQRVLDRFSERYREHWVDASGYLVQRTDASRRRAADAPRGSGTAIAAYFLSFADAELSRDLHAAMSGPGRRSVLGFSAIAEYARGREGRGDVDSGPVILGVGVTATGFAIASARAHRDRELFVELARTANLFGVPTARGEGRAFVAGGPIGNAIMLAALTALAPDDLARSIAPCR